MSCGGYLTGTIIRPGDREYEQARQEWNKAIDTFPIAIVYCYSANDIANAIHWSRRTGIPLRIRSGGHHYEGYSSGTGILVIDTTFINGVNVDASSATVRVQAGTWLQKVYETLYQYGYSFPGGTCPSVAISGLTLGGGIGLSTRLMGLTSDNLLEAEMVDANGDILTVNQCCNPDLFWALRGAGGGNFGVVTSYKFKVERVNKITLIQLVWNDNKPARLEFLGVWQEILKQLDRRISIFGGIYKQGAYLDAFFYGKPEEAERIIEPFLNIPGITFKEIIYEDFIDAVKTVGEHAQRTAFKSTGRFVERDLCCRELENIINIMDEAPSDYSSYISVYSLGGAVRDVSECSTAFFYRQANYIIGISSNWEEKDEAAIHKEWVAKGFDYIKRITSGSYINFPYSKLDDYEQAYYGEHVARLRHIKNKYDPDNVFSFPQSIKL